VESGKDQMVNSEAEQLFAKGLRAIAEGSTLAALVNFERAAQLESNPVYRSYLAFCIAKERGQVQKGVALCQEAIEVEPENSTHYLNLGKIQLLAGRKDDAIETFRKGLGHEQNQQILDEVHKLEPRNPPVISFLHRDNPINKYLGKILKRLGLR
jgi:tetratricopeptide (TPR) repeat protein